MSDRLRSIIADLLLAIFAFLAAVILLIGASDLPPPRFEPLGSAALPRILAVVIIFFSLIIALRAYLKNKTSTSVSSFSGETDVEPRRGALVLAALIIYVFALDVLRVPFLVATPVFVIAVGLSIGERSWTNALAFASLGLLLAFGISFVLEHLLYIRIG
jgi:putative tricarboxylic transport membrane protein